MFDKMKNRSPPATFHEDQGAAHLPQVSSGAVLHGQQGKIVQGDALHLLWNILSRHHVDVIQPE